MDITAYFDNHELAFYAARALLLVLALLAFAIGFARWRRAGSREMRQLFIELGESRGETRQLADVARQLAERIEALQARLEDRRELALASAAPSLRGYELALQMARNGATPEEMVSASGVTRHEAALLARLHNPERRQGA